MTTIYFDESSYLWDKNLDCNEYIVRTTCEYLSDLFNYKGYIYLNQIYEQFGVEWDPRIGNIEFVRGNCTPKIKINYHKDEENNRYEISVGF